ncbi:kinase-like domain-containing protein [Podospora didyma]|uniref:Kinase-like domain-containing protein n=1 Tax=Podospora didyma TaxID=330526 RepID=A0AAE0K8L7_9PEZI|nr:kinase-like domain-containing protein [Podospora didyma]
MNIPTHGGTQHQPDVSISQPPHAEIQRFRHYMNNGLNSHEHNGVDGGGNEVKFVCREALDEYWSGIKIANVLRRDKTDVTLSAKEIKTDYLIVFSILCYLSLSHLIQHFVDGEHGDGRLPVRDLQAFPRHKDPKLAGSWKAFWNQQWMFVPFKMDKYHHRKELSYETILPICEREVLSEREEGEVWRARIYHCCGEVELESGPVKSNIIVMKTTSYDIWDNEVNVYSALSHGLERDRRVGAPSLYDHIIQYHGSFTQPRTPNQTLNNTLGRLSNPDARPGKTHTILLEYAEGGDLTKFCKDHIDIVCSKKEEEIRRLWDRLFELLAGLYLIHEIGGTHQDIKEANILYTGDSDYYGDKPCFKICDLGRSHVKHEKGDRDKNNVGDRPFMAPECCSISSAQLVILPQYRKSADIWALGCLYSEMLIWCRLGPDGLQRYRGARQQENSENHSIRGSGYDRGFHDGINRLKCVESFHNEALSGCSEDSDLLFISNLILTKMLRRESNREREANALKVAWENHQKPLKTEIPRGPVDKIAAVPSTPGAFHPQHTASVHHTPISDQQVPIPQGLPLGAEEIGGAVCSVAQIAAFLETHKRLGKKDFPQVQWWLRRACLKNRRHVFLVESSPSMVAHKVRVVDTVRVLAKLVKRTAGVPMEVSVLDEEPLCVSEKSTALAAAVEKRHFHEGLPSWELGNTLSIMAERLVHTFSHAIPGLSVYILTDGAFEDPQPNLTSPIEVLIKAWETLPPPYLSINIIKFGNAMDAGQMLEQVRLDVESKVNPPDR